VESYSLDYCSKLPECIVNVTCKLQLPSKAPNVANLEHSSSLSQLETATVQPGQRLSIPAKYSN